MASGFLVEVRAPATDSACCGDERRPVAGAAGDLEHARAARRAPGCPCACARGRPAARACRRSSRIRPRAGRSRLPGSFLHSFIRVSYLDGALVLDSPHSGHDFPADFDADRERGGAARVGGLLRRRALRRGARARRAAPRRDLSAHLPRSQSQRRRRRPRADRRGPWPWEYRPSGKARIGKSLIWRTLEDGRPIYARKLTPEAVRRRIERFHAPYHRSLQELLESATRKSGRVYHINCHSMRCVAGKQSEDGAGSVRPDFVLGDRDGTTCEPRFTELVRETLAGMGYRVTVNDPYKGVELIRAYSDPKAGRHSLQIEINKRLYMDEDDAGEDRGLCAAAEESRRASQGAASSRCEIPDRDFAAGHLGLPQGQQRRRIRACPRLGKARAERDGPGAHPRQRVFRRDRSRFSLQGESQDR